eukprot:SAG31_NODE_1762_length_7323_cov_10.940753_5_plen_95_part_00
MEWPMLSTDSLVHYRTTAEKRRIGTAGSVSPFYDTQSDSDSNRAALQADLSVRAKFAIEYHVQLPQTAAARTHHWTDAPVQQSSGDRANRAARH